MAVIYKRFKILDNNYLDSNRITLTLLKKTCSSMQTKCQNQMVRQLVTHRYLQKEQVVCKQLIYIFF